MILTEEELVRWGQRIGEEIEAPAFVALRGHLGAGKSVLARAIARGVHAAETLGDLVSWKDRYG